MASPTPSVIRDHLAQRVRSIDVLDGGGGGASCAINRAFAHGRPDCLTQQADGPTQWTVAVLTIGILAVLHGYRLIAVLAEARPQNARVLRELCIAGLGAVALGLFWRDLRRCRMHEGLLKLIALVGVANLLLPCVWVVPPPREALEEEEEGQRQPQAVQEGAGDDDLQY